MFLAVFFFLVFHLVLRWPVPQFCTNAIYRCLQEASVVICCCRFPHFDQSAISHNYFHHVLFLRQLILEKNWVWTVKSTTVEVSDRLLSTTSDFCGCVLGVIVARIIHSSAHTLTRLLINNRCGAQSLILDIAADLWFT